MTKLPAFGFFKDPEDEVRLHRYLWEQFLYKLHSRLYSPAKPVRVVPALREPAAPFEQRGERHVTSAAEIGEIRGAATAHGPVVDWAPPALAHSLTPPPAPIVTSMWQHLQNPEQQLKAVIESEYAQFCREHMFPLAEAQRLEAEKTKSHKPKVTP